MAKKYLDYDGLLYFWQKIKANFVTDIAYDSTSRKIKKAKAGSTSDVVTLAKVATSGSYNDLSGKPIIPEEAQPTITTPKMDGTAAVGTEDAFARGDHVHPSDTSRVPTTRTVNGWDLSSDIEIEASDIPINGLGIQATNVQEAIENVAIDCANQNAFSNVKVGNTQIKADFVTDMLELVAGSNVTLTPDATNDKVTIDATDTTYSDATTSTHGLMSSTDKSKLDGIAAGAEVNVNADWDASSGDAQILNKPTLGTAAAKGVVTSISADSANLPTATAVKNYVATAITGAAAFQGTAPTSFAPTNYKKGYYWVVGTAGTYVGETCEAGDMIFAVEDYNSAYSASDFNVIQTNLDITAITNAEIDTIVAA